MIVGEIQRRMWRTDDGSIARWWSMPVRVSFYESHFPNETNNGAVDDDDRDVDAAIFDDDGGVISLVISSFTLF